LRRTDWRKSADLNFTPEAIGRKAFFGSQKETGAAPIGAAPV
jgi:hypothetical protein